jgi:hypothetical protein
MKGTRKYLLLWIQIISIIFGLIGFLIASIAAENLVWRGVCAVFLFINGYITASIHRKL